MLFLSLHSTIDFAMASTNKVWIGGIPSDATIQDVAVAIYDYGSATDIKLITPNGRMAYAFAECDDGFSPYIFCNDIMLNGYKLLVKKPAYHRKSSIWLGGLPKSITKQQILDEFPEFDIDEVTIVKQERRIPFAFVTFYSTDDVDVAMEKNIVIDDMKISLRRYNHASKKELEMDQHDPHVVYLYNLPSKFASSHLNFKDFLDKNNVPRKFYYVRFSNCHSAEAKVGFHNMNDAVSFNEMMMGYQMDGSRIYSDLR